MDRISAMNFKTSAKLIAIVFALLFGATSAFGDPTPANNDGVIQGSLAELTNFYINEGQNASMAAFLSPAQNPLGANVIGPDGRQLAGTLSSATITTTPTLFPPTPVITASMPSSAMAQYLQLELKKHQYDGNLPRDRELAAYLLQAGQDTVSIAQFPPFVAAKAQAEQAAQVTGAGNAFADMAKQQSSAAIEFCSKYMINFTQDPTNPWNKLRDQLFVPIGILLLLPGAVICQVRAIVAAGSPVVGQTAMGDQVNCFDGILRSIVAIFLIPGTYLVVNYGIDISNSISYTLSSEYTRLFGSNMYNDAICAEIRAHPSRDYQENLGASRTQQTVWPQTQPTDWASLERDAYDSKLDDPCTKTYQASPDRADELMPASASFSRALAFGGNAALTTAWNVLCAFQMVYLVYLFLIGPVIAGLWVWPTQQLQQALPSWIEGCITVCFWTLFWNTVILLMACFKGVSGDTGTIMMSALNFLATSAVKYAFDFAGLVKAAGAEAAQKATSKGGGGSGNSRGAGRGQRGAAGAPPAKGAPAPGHGRGPAPDPAHPVRTIDGVIVPTDTTRPDGLLTTTTAAGGGVPSLAAGLPVVPGPQIAPPPSAHAGVPGAGQSFVGSAQIRMPNGHTYSLDMKVDPATGHQIAALTDARHRQIGSLDLSKGQSAVGSFHTASGDFKLAAQTNADGHQFTLTTPDGKLGTLALHNFLNGGAPPVNPRGIQLPPGATALADLAGTGALIRQADGSLAVVSPTSGIHPLQGNQPLNVDGTTIQVGMGTAPGGQSFLEVSEMRANGMTDVAMYPQAASQTAVPPAAMTQDAVAALNALSVQEQHGQYQVVNDGQHIQAIGADHRAFAQFDSVKGWQALGANGQVLDIVAGQNGQWLAAGSVPVTATADGGFVAAGTTFAYDSASSTFNVNGDNISASVLNGDLLQQAAMNVPSADIVCHELSLPGVAENLAAINTDPNALAQVQAALQGTGVDAQTLYQAAIQGSPVEAVQVMAQALTANPTYAEQFSAQLGLPDARIMMDAGTDRIAAAQVLSAEMAQAEAANPGSIHQIAQTMGVSDAVLAGASSNVFYAAQVMSADVAHYGTPDYVHQVAAQMGVSDAVLTAGAQLPVASAQLVAAESTQSAFFAGEVSSALGGQVSPDLVSAAAVSPIAAAQLMGMAAQNDASYANYVAQTVGVPSADTVTAAAYYPSVAAQLVGMEASQSAPYAAAIAQALPSFESTLITQSATSLLAAVQLAAAGAGLDPAYAAQIAPTMQLQSMQDFAAVANNPIYAAQALSAETSNNAGYVNYVANTLQLSPDVVLQAAGNMLAATQMVGADSIINNSYGTYAAGALQVSDPRIMQLAAQDPVVAAQVLATAAASNPDSLLYVAGTLGVQPQVLAQAQYNIDAATFVANNSANYTSIEPASLAPTVNTASYGPEQVAQLFSLLESATQPSSLTPFSATEFYAGSDDRMPLSVIL